MTALARCAQRRAHELPPVLTTSEVDGVLSGSLTPVRPETAMPKQPSAKTPSPPARRSPDAADLPDPRVWVSRFAVALLECLEGHRPPMQLAKHVHPDVLARLNRRYRAALRRGTHPGATRIKRIRVCQPRADVAEAALVTRVCGRPCPIALRMCGVDGRWVVTVFETI